MTRGQAGDVSWATIIVNLRIGIGSPLVNIAVKAPAAGSREHTFSQKVVQKSIDTRLDQN
jgi:hypothetical protein